jgi:hypothetical protein
MRRDQLTAFAASLLSTDVVVVEATGNAAVAAVISPHVRRVVIANPMQVRGWPMSRSRPTPLMPASFAPVLCPDTLIMFGHEPITLPWSLETKLFGA